MKKNIKNGIAAPAAGGWKHTSKKDNITTGIVRRINRIRESGIRHAEALRSASIVKSDAAVPQEESGFLRAEQLAMLNHLKDSDLNAFNCALILVDGFTEFLETPLRSRNVDVIIVPPDSQYCMAGGMPQFDTVFVHGTAFDADGGFMIPEPMFHALHSLGDSRMASGQLKIVIVARDTAFTPDRLAQRFMLPGSCHGLLTPSGLFPLGLLEYLYADGQPPLSAKLSLARKSVIGQRYVITQGAGK